MENESKRTTDIRKHIRVMTDKIRRFLPENAAPDVLIIKSHLICEYYLNQILVFKGCESKELDKITFAEKLTRALDGSVNNEKKTAQSLRLLNKLRNKVGHELEYVLSESDVDKLGFVQGKDYILSKYDFDDLQQLLHDTLSTIVIDIGALVYRMIDAEKRAAAERVMATQQIVAREDKGTVQPSADEH